MHGPKTLSRAQACGTGVEATKNRGNVTRVFSVRASVLAGLANKIWVPNLNKPINEKRKEKGDIIIAATEKKDKEDCVILSVLTIGK